MAHKEHEILIKELAQQMEPILNKSNHAMYIYLDDEHKICNKKFADMLGYKTVNEWVKNLYPISDVDESDQDKGIQAYMSASRNFHASTLPATWVHKNGKKIKTLVTMAPVSYKGEIFVIHYIVPAE